MLTVEKVIELDDKVNQAVKVIESLNTENKLLKTKISSYKKKIEKLEEIIFAFKNDQDKIESGIRNAVETLNHMLEQALEDTEALKKESENTKKSQNDFDSNQKKNKEKQQNDSPILLEKNNELEDERENISKNSELDIF